jgi:hypothetical protein
VDVGGRALGINEALFVIHQPRRTQAYVEAVSRFLQWERGERAIRPPRGRRIANEFQSFLEAPPGLEADFLDARFVTES